MLLYSDCYFYIAPCHYAKLFIALFVNYPLPLQVVKLSVEWTLFCLQHSPLVLVVVMN